MVNLIGPAVFGLIWFTVFGGAAIHLEMFQQATLGEAVTNQGVEVAMFEFLKYFPLSQIIMPIFFLTICLSFTTMADSMTSTMALMSTNRLSIKEDIEAPGLLKIVWGVMLGGVTLLMILFGGLNGLRMLSVVVGVASDPRRSRTSSTVVGSQ